MDLREEALKLHEKWGGKLEINSKVKVKTAYDLSMAYTPGVAEPCLEIQKDIKKSYTYTGRSNTIAVISDGSAVLGLGDIGPEASMPVMEGKSVLFKTFGNIDAVPLCLKTKDVDEIVNTIYLLSGSFGGINLEDIGAPRCFEIERKLKEKCDIPVFHDDQHGTAVVTGAGVINGLRFVGKNIENVKIVLNGAGAAGIAITEFLLELGVQNILVCDRNGILSRDMDGLRPSHQVIAEKTNKNLEKGKLSYAMVDADIFIGVSAPNIVSKNMVASMAENAIVFPLANPVSEISRKDALDAGARIVGTGSSENPNQINNVLVFPGIFRGALEAQANDITSEMMIAACYAIAESVSDEQLNEDYIIPYAFDDLVHKNVADAVSKAVEK